MLSPATIALLALTASQDPANASMKPARPEWRDFDRVVMIVNQDIITERQLARAIQAEKNARPTMNESENQNLQNEIFMQSVRKRLSAQAGQDLGADEQLVDRNVQERIDRAINNCNGVVGLSKILQEKDMTIQDLKREWREDLFRSVWEDSVTGEGAGISTRPTRDRYVRPGAIAFEYENALRDPPSFQALGGKPDMFTLQRLTLDPARNGGPEKTRELALELTQRIAAGEDMADLVRHYSMSTDNNGIDIPVELAQLQRIQPAVAGFVAHSKVGDVSPPVTGDTKSGGLIQLVRVVEHTPGVVPQFTSPEVQQKVNKGVRDDLDRYRLDRAYDRLIQAAYVWPDQVAAAKQANQPGT